MSEYQRHTQSRRGHAGLRHGESHVRSSSPNRQQNPQNSNARFSNNSRSNSQYSSRGANLGSHQYAHGKHNVNRNTSYRTSVNSGSRTYRRPNTTNVATHSHKRNIYNSKDRYQTNNRSRRSAANANGYASNSGINFDPTFSISNTLTNAKRGVLQSKVPLIVIGIILLIIIIGIVRVFTYPNIYSGVKIGDVDVSGMTQAQASEAVSNYYSSRIEGTTVRVFAGDAGKENYYNGESNKEEIAEQVSAQEANENVNYWDIGSASIGAHANADELATHAWEVGRSDGGFLVRLGSQLFGHKIDMQLGYDDVLFDKFVSNINSTIGYERCDWDIELHDGVASVTSGYNGEEVNRDTLLSDLSHAFTHGDTETEIVARAQNAPVRINQSQAEKVADEVNNAISNGIMVNFSGTNHSYTNAQVGGWVQTRKDEGNTGWTLTPYISSKKFSNDFYADFKNSANITDTQVTFENSSDNIVVHTNGSGQVPALTTAISSMNSLLFESSENSSNSSGQPTINIDMENVPESMTFDEALEMQVINEVSTYTTSFSNSTGTEARNTNIRLGASELNNTICSANGGTWSFNGIVGDTTQEKGYLAAGSIAEGEYVDTYGGGICQVATTVFNALYESPYKITERHPHSLYISSYPAGRDAAIAWSDLDLTWQNETTSDVLMVTSADDVSVTISLYSAPQTFSVESELGDWEEGSKYQTVVKEDENLAKGYSYVKTTGSDGSKISVTRTVYGLNKEVLYTNEFVSEYEPKNKVIVCGPGTEVDTSSS